MAVVSKREPVDVVERALVRIRRNQQAQRLRHAASGDGAPGASAADAARFRYLDALEDADRGMAISEVGEAIGVDRPRASRLTSELLGDGLIERHANPEDSRYSVVRLTASGRAIVNEVHRSRRAAVAEALAGFTPDESRAFAEMLDRFVTAWPRAGRPTG